MSQKKSSKKRIWYIVGAVVLLAVIFRFCSGGEKSKRVFVDKVKRATITEKVEASGKVYPVDEVKVSSEVSGEVREIHIEEGDSVKAGQLLVKIRPDNLQSVVERATANLDMQKANLAQAKARLSQAESRHAQSKVDMDRNQKLFNQNIISATELQTSKVNFEVAGAELEAAKQSVEAANFTIKSSEASLREARENLSLTSIYAPMTGVVTKLSVEKGEKVVGTSQMAGTEILRIANLDMMEVRVDVSENYIVKVNLGDPAIIEVDAYAEKEEKFRGIVMSISNSAKEGAVTTADAITEFEVKIRISKESYQHLVDQTKKSPFRPGMSANVEVITDTKDNVLAVPHSSVTTRPKNDKSWGEEEEQEEEETNQAKKSAKEELQVVVFVFEDGKAVKRVVKTGISDFDNIEILEGLKEGDEIITGPYLEVSKKLKNNERVINRNTEKKEGEDTENKGDSLSAKE